MRPSDADGAYMVVCASLDEYYERSVIDFFMFQWPEGQFVAVDMFGNVAGYLAGSRLQNGRASVALFCVSPEFRGRGVGSSLLSRFMTSARFSGCREIQLEVRVENTDAIRFYRKRGFVPTDNLISFYNDGGAAVRLIASSYNDRLT